MIDYKKMTEADLLSDDYAEINILLEHDGVLTRISEEAFGEKRHSLLGIRIEPEHSGSSRRQWYSYTDHSFEELLEAAVLNPRCMVVQLTEERQYSVNTTGICVVLAAGSGRDDAFLIHYYDPADDEIHWKWIVNDGYAYDTLPQEPQVL